MTSMQLDQITFDLDPRRRCRRRRSASADRAAGQATCRDRRCGPELSAAWLRGATRSPVQPAEFDRRVTQTCPAADAAGAPRLIRPLVSSESVPVRLESSRSWVERTGAHSMPSLTESTLHASIRLIALRSAAALGAPRGIGRRCHYPSCAPSTRIRRYCSLQTIFQLLESRLQDRVLPALDHGALGLGKPLLAQLPPCGNGGAKGLIFFGHSALQLLDLRASRLQRKLPLSPAKLGVEQCALELEPSEPVSSSSPAQSAHGRDEPLRRVPLPPSHSIAIVMREHVMKIMVALTVGQQRHNAIVARGVVFGVGLSAPHVRQRIDEKRRSDG